MPRKNTLAVTGDEERSASLSRRISNVISRIREQKKLTQAKLAAEMGLSRTTLNMLLNHERGNTWRLPTLCAASRVLGTPVWEIVRLAETSMGDEVDLGAINQVLFLSMLNTTSPRSPERLRHLVARAVGIVIDMDPDCWEADYRCSVAEIEAGVPQFYSDYTSGVLTDEEALRFLERAYTYFKEHEPCLFWVALRQVYPVK